MLSFHYRELSFAKIQVNDKCTENDQNSNHWFPLSRDKHVEGFLFSVQNVGWDKKSTFFHSMHVDKSDKLI